MKEKFEKNIENEIEKISSFLQTETFQIVHKNKFPLNESEITLTKLQENYSVDFDLKLKTPQNPNEVTFKKLGFNEDFKLISNEKTFLIPAKSATRIVGKSFVQSESIKGNLGTIYSENFPTTSNSIFRTILKIGKDSLTTIFLGAQYSCRKIHYGLGLIVIEVDNLVFHVYRHSQKDFNFLVIECLNKTDLETFKTISELTLKSIGFLTGNWHQNEQFIFSYKSSMFENANSIYYESLGESIISHQEIINPSQFRTFIQPDSEKRPLLTPLLFPEKSLSQLISDLKVKPELERTVELLIEGNAIKPPLVRCSNFHVALETIVGLINSENKKFFEPIKSSENLESLKEELKSLVLSKKEKFSKIELESLNKKITYINTPFNKDRFLLAFDFYRIELPEKLKKLLNNRNKFLHGKMPYKEGLLKTKIKELNLEADRIHLLVSILILKHSGYKGHIKNQAAYRLEIKKMLEDYDLKIDESAFYRI
ncbi:hypothetical protein [Winogradskyella sp.]|uniref:hypothetical protein n=1 Tax=Winogradskyella sp. TaxID=1883156 RepID=UPI00261A4340|nr:hypothetical protein [Winogradskyella sp.]